MFFGASKTTMKPSHIPDERRQVAVLGDEPLEEVETCGYRGTSWLPLLITIALMIPFDKL